MRLDLLWNKRRSAFWGEILPYLRYVMQSGLLMLLGFLFIGGFAAYVSLLEHIPPDFPIRLYSLIILMPFVTYSGFRTFIRTADVIYLLPVEPRMGEYFRKSFVYSIVLQAVGLSFVYLLLWPVYLRADEAPKAFLLLWIVWLAVKLLNNYGSWQERKMRDATARFGYRLLRWSVSLILIAVWLWQPEWKAAIFTALVVITYAIALRFPVKHLVPWEYLIALEREQRGRFMLFLSWFVDVPSLPQRVHTRVWLNWLSSRIPFKQQSTYLYLYTKTFLRSDVFGMLLRMTILGMLILSWVRHSHWAAAVYGLFLFIGGTQLTAVRHFHTYSFWRSIYPLPISACKRDIVKIAFRAHAVMAILLWLPLVFSSLGLGGRILWLLGGIGFIIIFRAAWSRKKWMEYDEEE